MRVYGLIVAGGSGKRLKGPLPKQFRPLAGRPVLAHTLEAFDACVAVTHLVLVVPAAHLDTCRSAVLAGLGLRCPLALVSGGEHRQDSVGRGLATIPEDNAVVVIHDGVRPLVACADILACVEGARRHGACTVAIPCWDTLKRVKPDLTVETTLPREAVWMVQTPQAFRAGLIRAAHDDAGRTAHFGTDDASLVERMGLQVHIVPGSRFNIKITTQEDLDLAEALLALRRPGTAEPAVDTAKSTP
jgi:2-C-methyl-D-erythritol 4-phosphate cytidylyltransferase